jgi:cell division protein FtsI/penicillin-binding protein 2
MGWVGGSAMMGLCAAFAVLFGRLIYINTHDAERLGEIVDRQRRGVTPIPARRGMIYDTAGRVMAGGRLAPSVFADPVMIADVVETSRTLSRVLNMPAGAIEQELRARRDSRFCWVKRGVERAEAEGIRMLASPEHESPSTTDRSLTVAARLTDRSLAVPLPYGRGSVRGSLPYGRGSVRGGALGDAGWVEVV